MIRESLDQFAERFAAPIGLTILVVSVFSLQQWQGAPLPAVDIAPEAGVELPVVWGNMGKRLVGVGVIDRKKWLELYGSLTDGEKRLLEGNSPEKLRITRENASYLLNLFWAFGLANRNPVLQDEAAMANPAYGGAGGFASTGGWTLSRGDAIEHYGKHVLVSFTPQQQALVEKVSKGIYRPCCNNSTHFPDCNHGMAMLGLLELMAAQGASEQEMWDAALTINSYWFPDAYLTVATYMQSKKGIAWSDVQPQEILSEKYSSYSGFSHVAAEVRVEGGGGASCSAS